jgi:hypothetical protein
MPQVYMGGTRTTRFAHRCFDLPVLCSNHLLRLGARQVVKRSRWNLGPALRITKQLNPVSVGLYLQASHSAQLRSGDRAGSTSKSTGGSAPTRAARDAWILRQLRPAGRARAPRQLEAELSRLGFIPLIVVDLGRHRHYADMPRIAVASCPLRVDFLASAPTDLSA